MPAAIPLVRMDADHAAARLRTLLGPGAEVSADKETNTVFLLAVAKQFARVRGLLARLDAPQDNYVDRLAIADPVPIARAAGAVMAMLATLGGDPEVRVVPLERDRAIFFTATDAQAKCVRWLVRQLDRRW